MDPVIKESLTTRLERAGCGQLGEPFLPAFLSATRGAMRHPKLEITVNDKIAVTGIVHAFWHPDTENKLCCAEWVFDN